MGRRSRLAAPLLVAAIIASVLCRHGDGAAASPADAVVTDTCNAIHGSFEDVGFDFCVSHLRSVPGASSTNRRGHLLMTADLATTAGSAAGDAASALARNERDPAAKDGLEACAILYRSGSVPALRLLREYAAAGSWKAAGSLKLLTMQAGGGCSGALFGSEEAKGRMAAANAEFTELTLMSTTLVNMLTSSPGR